ncbi:MAG TPA: hypothetical protein VMG59_02420 [Phycisphaerae bacterium]|nr:hypothetical protein [Phycisphaerae bacterium]
MRQQTGPNLSIPEKTSIELIKIILLVITLSAAYGILHDQITARVCKEYFTVDHPDLGWPAIFHNTHPTILAFAWGIVATVPLATVLAIVLALAAQAGTWPRISARMLFFPLLAIFFCMGLLAFGAGFTSYHAALMQHQQSGYVIPAEQADFAAHLMSYCAGTLGAVLLTLGVLLIRFLRRRKSIK